jgi:hypothetical protein
VAGNTQHEIEAIIKEKETHRLLRECQDAELMNESSQVNSNSNHIKRNRALNVSETSFGSISVSDTVVESFTNTTSLD